MGTSQSRLPKITKGCKTTRAVGYLEHGSKQVLRDLTLPVLTGLHPDHVMITVKASTVDAYDLNRLAGKQDYFAPESSWPRVIGVEGSGTIASIGSNVFGFRTHDEVIFRVGIDSAYYGGLSETIVIPQQCIAKKPRKLSFEYAAALPYDALRAYQGLTCATIEQDKTKVLILDGDCHVGLMAVQVAKRMLKAHTVAVVVKTKEAEARCLENGADVVIVRGTRKFGKLDEVAALDPDVILDVDGHGYAVMQALPKEEREPSRTMISIGDMPTSDSLAAAGYPVSMYGSIYLYLHLSNAGANAQALGIHWEHCFSTFNQDDLNAICTAVDAGDIRPIVQSVTPFDNWRDAILKLELVDEVGKRVVSMQVSPLEIQESKSLNEHMYDHNTVHGVAPV